MGPRLEGPNRMYIVTRGTRIPNTRINYRRGAETNKQGVGMGCGQEKEVESDALIGQL